MNQPNKTLPLWQVLLCGAAIVTLSMGVRHGFGLWLQPITQAQNWTRENFAFAMAIQNLTWGFFSIFSGMVADKFGACRVKLPACNCRASKGHSCTRCTPSRNNAVARGV
jgi:hypothetical protein